MSLKICVLASGSSGNCVYVASGHTAILVDAGLSYRETEARMDSAGLDLRGVKAICVTHDHNDHVSSIGVMYRKLGVDLYANMDTIEVVERIESNSNLPWKVFGTGQVFTIGDLKIEAFSVPHDASDPVGFVISSGTSRIGLVTDMGTPTELIRTRLRNCQIVVAEFNHDEHLLRTSSRPWPVKQRIAGPHGHLSNEQACQLLVDIAGPDLKTVFLAHLSLECNKPDLAVKAAEAMLAKSGFQHVAVKLTYDDKVSEVAEC
jgi:phosphoribosyl 1,2-cyclic phosphodiesterase